MTTYRVYYKEHGYGTLYCYVEVADFDENGKKISARERCKNAREAAVLEQGIKEEQIVKVVKDC